MITLNLSPELENKIQEEAKSKGLSIEQYLQDLIEEKLINNNQIISQVSEDEDWERNLMNFINLPLDVNVQPLSDQAISRENIYTREDEML